MAATGVGAELLRTASSLVLSTPAVAVMLLIAVFFPALLLAWAVQHTVYSAQSRVLAMSGDQVFLELKGIGGASVLVLVNVPLSVVDAAGALANTVLDNLQTMVVLVLAAVLSLGYLQVQPQIAETLLALRECTANEIVETFVWPFVNLGRLAYAIVWPIINVLAELYKFVTTDYYQLLLQCTSPTDLEAFLAAMGDGVAALVTAIATWAAGNIETGRIDFLTSLELFGDAANALLAPADCFCADLDPVWQLAVAVPQLASLQTALDAALNVPVRALQFLLKFLVLSFGEVDLGPMATEINAALIAAGDAIEDVVLLVLNMLLGILVEIGVLSADAQDVPSDIPDARAWALANDLHSQGLPLWQQPPTGGLLNSTLGFAQLLALLSTPWSHIVTEPLAFGVSLVNATLVAVSHATCKTVLTSTCDCLFDGPSGQRFLQLGYLGDRWLAAVDAAASVFTIFDSNLPDVLAHLGRAVVYSVEAVPELIREVVYAIVFPPWTPQDPGDTTCDVCDSCDFSSPPPGWSFFEVFPFYLNRTSSCINKARDELLLDADALAVLAGAHLFYDT
jgi:hypothetical protein